MHVHLVLFFIENIHFHLKYHATKQFLRLTFIPFESFDTWQVIFLLHVVHIFLLESSVIERVQQ